VQAETTPHAPGCRPRRGETRHEAPSMSDCHLGKAVPRTQPQLNSARKTPNRLIGRGKGRWVFSVPPALYRDHQLGRFTRRDLPADETPPPFPSQRCPMRFPRFLVRNDDDGKLNTLFPNLIGHCLSCSSSLPDRTILRLGDSLHQQNFTSLLLPVPVTLFINLIITFYFFYFVNTIL
jgi:hypothetical protein